MGKNKFKKFKKAPVCHEGTVDFINVPVGDKNLIISGGGHSRGVDFSDSDIVFDLARSIKSNIKMNEAAKANPIFTRLCKADTPFVEIDWPDFGIPKLNVEFWDDLIDVLKEFTAEHDSKTVRATFCCMGGHGRTGTALAILAYKFDTCDVGQSPVAKVRADYCERTVECESQLRYIEAMCDIVLTDKPSKSSYVTSAYAYKPNEVSIGYAEHLFTRGDGFRSGQRYSIRDGWQTQVDGQWIPATPAGTEGKPFSNNGKLWHDGASLYRVKPVPKKQEAVKPTTPSSVKGRLPFTNDVRPKRILIETDDSFDPATGESLAMMNAEDVIIGSGIDDEFFDTDKIVQTTKIAEMFAEKSL